MLQISFKYVPFCQLVGENRSPITPKQSTIEANIVIKISFKKKRDYKIYEKKKICN